MIQLPCSVLVTCAGAPVAPYLIRSLKGSDLVERVIAADVKEHAVGRSVADAFHRVPPGDDPAYLDRVLEICSTEDLTVVLVGADEEAFTLALATPQLEAAGIRANTPGPGLAPILQSKAEVYRWLAERGIEMPAFHSAASIPALVEAAGALGYPDRSIVVKPASSRGGRGVWILDRDGLSRSDLLYGRETNKMTLEAFTQSLGDGHVPELIVMARLEGTIYDVDVLSRKDRVHRLVPRRRLDPSGSPLWGAEIVADEGLLAFSRRVAETVGMEALYDLDVVLEPSGPSLLEVNPRPSGSAINSVAAGHPIFDDMLRMFAGQELAEQPPVRPSVVRPYFEMVVEPGT